MRDFMVFPEVQPELPAVVWAGQFYSRTVPDALSKRDRRV